MTMKRKLWMLLLATIVLLSIFTTNLDTVSGFSGQIYNIYSDLNVISNPSPSRVETLTLQSPRGTHQEVQVYLPQGYDSSNETYPVLYLSDGSSYFGKLGNIPFIIVGITFSWNERWDKYSPWVNNEMEKWFGLSSPRGGAGDEYLSYLVGLKTSHIDTKYRTKPEPQHTAIGGHSMGGFFSIYAGIKRSDVFSKVIAFSPAVWFGSKDINNWLSNNNFIDYVSQNNPGNVSFFTYVGGKEDHQHEAPGYPLVGEFPKIYLDGAKAVNKLVGGEFIFDPDGTHSTTDFISWFPAIVDWLEATGFGFKRVVPINPTPQGPTPENPTQAPIEPTSTMEPFIEPIIIATPKPDGSVIHVVLYGQSLWSIADIYEIPLADLIANNNLTEESTIFLNQELIIVPAVPAIADVAETDETTASEEAPEPTKTLAPTPTRTYTPTSTKTPFSTPTRVIPTPIEEMDTSGILRFGIFDGHTPLWIGIGLIATGVIIFALIFNPSYLKRK